MLTLKYQINAGKRGIEQEASSKTAYIPGLNILKGGEETQKGLGKQRGMAVNIQKKKQEENLLATPRKEAFAGHMRSRQRRER